MIQPGDPEVHKCVYKGPRVRIGLHTGISRTQDVHQVRKYHTVHTC